VGANNFKSKPIVATDEEKYDLEKLEQLLNHFSHSDHRQLPRIVSPEGEELELPKSVFLLLSQLISQLVQGKGVVISTFNLPLTVEEAAMLLDFPRQHLIKLLNDGEIPSTGKGIRRRIQFTDLMAYKQKWEELRHEAVVDIAQMSHEAGVYFTAHQQTHKSTNTPARHSKE